MENQVKTQLQYCLIIRFQYLTDYGKYPAQQVFYVLEELLGKVIQIHLAIHNQILQLRPLRPICTETTQAYRLILLCETLT